MIETSLLLRVRTLLHKLLLCSKLGSDMTGGALWVQVRLTEVDTARLPQDEVAAGKTTAGHRLERSSNRHAVR